MLSTSRLQTARGIGRHCKPWNRSFARSAQTLEQSKSPTTAQSSTSSSQPIVVEEKHIKVMQAPNRAELWARSQKPRSSAMTGPRFEQTDFSLQPAPYSAMELVHEQAVEWTSARMVACDGGGGPAGHPRIYINTDKPEITPCGYCGKPFANEHNRKHLESLPQTSYPLTS